MKAKGLPLLTVTGLLLTARGRRAWSGVLKNSAAKQARLLRAEREQGAREPEKR
jgi:hypothetical protein